MEGYPVVSFEEANGYDLILYDLPLWVYVSLCVRVWT